MRYRSANAVRIAASAPPSSSPTALWRPESLDTDLADAATYSQTIALTAAFLSSPTWAANAQQGRADDLAAQLIESL